MFFRLPKNVQGRQASNPNADCVINGIGDGRCNRQYSHFRYPLGFERPCRIGVIDKNGCYLSGCIRDFRNTAFRQPIGLVDTALDYELFRNGISHSHNNRRFDLGESRFRVEDLSAIEGNYCVQQLYATLLPVHLDSDGRGVIRDSVMGLVEPGIDGETLVRVFQHRKSLAEHIKHIR